MLKLATTKTAFCSYPWRKIKITCDGYVTMCCFHQRNCLGNILHNSLEEIWNSPLANEIREKTSEHRLHSTCASSTCPFVYTKDKLASLAVDFADTGYPVELEIDLPTQHCNIGGENPSKKTPACIMCERSRYFKKQEDKLDEICKKLRKYTRYFQHIHIQGVAEPFWKDRLFEIADMLEFDNYMNKAAISTVTNGTILNMERIDKWLKYPNSYLTFSLDASTPETFKKIRILDAYEKVVDNLIIVASRRKPNQRLKIHNNINIINLGEVEGMVELAAMVKVDTLEFNPTYACPSIEVNASNAPLFKEAQKVILETAKRLGVNVVLFSDLALNY